jgi:molecular chaperone IbpA
MTRYTTLDLPTFTRATVGFDRIFDEMDRVFQNSKTTAYPPYNIIKADENTYLIEIAVAGFDEQDFDIELHKGMLTVRADVTASDVETNYIHKGIAARNFERKFTLAETVEVDSVSLHQGMLTIRLVNIVPEELQPKKIAINATKIIDSK